LEGENMKAADSIYRFLLVVMCCVFLCGTASANITNTIPYTNSFEQHPHGTLYAGNYGWFSSDTNYAMVLTTNDYKAEFSKTSRPLPDSVGHTNLLFLDESMGKAITNLFEELTPRVTNVYIDVMAQMWPSSDDETPRGSITNDTTVQAAIYVNGESNVVIFHSIKTGTFDRSNTFSTVTGSTVPPAEWNRVTIAMDYYTDTSGQPDNFFEVRLNGMELQHANGFDSVSDLNATGSWFRCANRTYYSGANKRYLSSIGFQGKAYLDDLMVVTEQPSYDVYVVSWATPARGGSIAPAGTNKLGTGEGILYTITPSNWWDIAHVWSNRPGEAAVDLGTSATNFLATNLTHSLEIHAEFVPEFVTNGVTKYWLVQHNLPPTDDAAMTDWDFDGRDTWEEFYELTHPSNDQSVFEIEDCGNDGGTNWLKWHSTSIDPFLAVDEAGKWNFQIQKNPDLKNAAGWVPASPASIPFPTQPKTNEWRETGAASGTTSYRVSVTNAPEQRY